MEGWNWLNGLQRHCYGEKRKFGCYEQIEIAIRGWVATQFDFMIVERSEFDFITVERRKCAILVCGVFIWLGNKI